MSKERKIVAALVKRGEDEKRLERQFWRDAGTEAKWEAVEQMKADYLIMNGRDLSELKLNRDVARLIRRKKKSETGTQE